MAASPVSGLPADGGDRPRSTAPAAHDGIMTRSWYGAEYANTAVAPDRAARALYTGCVLYSDGPPRGLGRIADGVAAEQAAPDCLDPDHMADPSTLRRWCWRRIESLRFLACATTLFAWDWRAAVRMLIAEPNPP